MTNTSSKLVYRRHYERERKQNPLDLPIGVVAHHQRLGFAYNLAHKVQAEVITIDEKGRSAEWNHKQMLTWMAEGDREWSVILEDDCIPAPNFRTQLEMALPWAPTPFVGLYVGRGRPPHWQAAISHTIANDVCWMTCNTLMNAVGYVVKTKLIPCLLYSLNQTWRARPRFPIDEAITVWGKQEKIEFSYTRPSLVEHRDIVPVQKHSYGTPTEKRKAWLFGYRESWDGSTTSLEYVPSW